MSVYESSITNPKKQLEFYKDLSEQLQQENKQLKLDYELYKDNCVYRNYEVETKDITIKQLKEVIEEVREVIEQGLDFDNPYYADKCEEKLLEILDKVKVD